MELAKKRVTRMERNLGIMPGVDRLKELETLSLEKRRRYNCLQILERLSCERMIRLILRDSMA